MRWPLPAVLTWLAAWGLAAGLNALGLPAWLALLLPTALGAAAALLPSVATTAWRRVFVAAGFPLSVLAQGATLGLGAGLAWLWLAPLALLLLAYPRRAWRDAPVYPTPRGALAELPQHVPLPAGARVLDAGCGMGDGLIALRQAWPEARMEGVEWSALWRWVSARRCPWASVRQGDLWADDWSAFDLVYVFQRPESMPRVMAKAEAEMRPGSWLVSLAFEALDPAAPGAAPRRWRAQACIDLAQGSHTGPVRQVWVYRVPQAWQAQPGKASKRG